MNENIQNPQDLQQDFTPAYEALGVSIYNRTVDSLVYALKALKLSPPPGVSEQVLASALALIQTEACPQALKDIAFIKGKKDIYYYDRTIMTEHYAQLSALIEDKDILWLIADVTRSDCKLYPRPTQFSKLQNVPFRLSMDELLGAQARMALMDEYKDIGVVTASNGKKGFYSDRFISRVYAQGLIEKIEVEDHENP